MTETSQLPPSIRKTKRRGIVDPDQVRTLSFTVITLCIIISVIACVLSIWDFTANDTLWRTVATCIVITGGMMAFGVINSLYGPKEN